jgi:hypothetical protein
MNKTIRITLSSKEDYINKYNKNRLDPALSKYILNECKSVRFKDNVDIEVEHDFDMSEQEKKKFVSMIRENFGLEVKELIIQTRKSLFFDIGMLLVGMIFIISSIYSVISVMAEVFLIVAWMFISKALYDLIFDEIKFTVILGREKKLTKCMVKFSKTL